MLLPALAAIACVQAQQVNGYRYWFDDDVASAVTASVTAAPEVTIAANWPTGTLLPGYHRVSVQVRDTDGNWTAPATSHFTRSASNITGYRFWVNDDVSDITTGSLAPGQSVNLNSAIAAGTLPRDYNAVTLQFRDADGEWSTPNTSLFVKNTGAVNGYEYWVDEDIANRTSGTIGPGTLVDLIADLPVPSSDGEHAFTIRFSGANGTWSVPLSTAFNYVVGIAELPGLSELLLFPNPVTDQLGLRLRADAACSLNLHVLDATGAVVRDLSHWAVSGSTYRNWDIGGLAPGTYLLRITDGTRTGSMRFVKR